MKHGITLAASGLALALSVGLLLKVTGVTPNMTWTQWLWGVAFTAVVQGALWLIPHLGLDAYLSRDPHYLYLPMLGAALLLSFYGYIAWEARVLVLMVWFGSLLFLAGRVGFGGVTGLSLVMAAGYLVGVLIRQDRGLPVSLGFELTAMVAFLVLTVFTGIVFDRLRHERLEKVELRRSLAELALTDALTALPNRRQFEETLRGALARIRRHGGRCNLVMVDVDHFKQFNDRRGHPEGDRVLRELATVIRAHFRAGDTAARYGGEEFAMIIHDIPAREARLVIERLRVMVEQHPFAGAHVLPEGRLTISAGLASCPEDGVEFEQLLCRADAALYTAKAQGRNRVCAAAASEAPG